MELTEHASRILGISLIVIYVAVLIASVLLFVRAFTKYRRRGKHDR